MKKILSNLKRVQELENKITKQKKRYNNYLNICGILLAISLSLIVCLFFFNLSKIVMIISVTASVISLCIAPFVTPDTVSEYMEIWDIKAWKVVKFLNQDNIQKIIEPKDIHYILEYTWETSLDLKDVNGGELVTRVIKGINEKSYFLQYIKLENDQMEHIQVYRIF